MSFLSDRVGWKWGWITKKHKAGERDWAEFKLEQKYICDFTLTQELLLLTSRRFVFTERERWHVEPLTRDDDSPEFRRAELPFWSYITPRPTTTSFPPKLSNIFFYWLPLFPFGTQRSRIHFICFIPFFVLLTHTLQCSVTSLISSLSSPGNVYLSLDQGHVHPYIK